MWKTVMAPIGLLATFLSVTAATPPVQLPALANGNIELEGSLGLLSPGLHAPAVQQAHRTIELAMLAIINRDRQGAGLRPLTFDNGLARAAMAHSVDMARHGYFSHQTPSGITPYQRLLALGIHYHIAGENLALARDESQDQLLPAVEAAMMRSPEHRDNLLRPAFTRVGIGIAFAGGRTYVTEDFRG
jgi:uncharacterized protein YkwD